jgi:hypothetical protein
MPSSPWISPFSRIKPIAVAFACALVSSACSVTPVIPAPVTATPPALGATSDASLRRYKIDSSQVSVSGISAGGALASQLHVALSSVFKKGVGLVAAPPYFCSQGSVANGLGYCTKATDTLKPPTAELIKAAETWSGSTIDSISNLSDTRVYIFSGALDSQVKQLSVNETDNFYRHFAGNANVHYKKDVPAEHSWVTNFYGTACAGFASPYINNCDYDLVGEMLKWIHGKLNPRATAIESNFLKFDQNEFRPDATRDRDGFDDTGWVYVPTSCKNGATCRIHVSLHGCMQGQSFVDDKFVRYAGYNEWAETNNMIVLYPQGVASGKVGTASFNPVGCWDWWGYSGGTGPNDYALKLGVQPSVIKKMTDRLKGII